MSSGKKLARKLDDSAKTTPATTGSTQALACWSVCSLNNEIDNGTN